MRVQTTAKGATRTHAHGFYLVSDPSSDAFLQTLSNLFALPGVPLTPGQKDMVMAGAQALNQSLLGFQSLMGVLTEGVVVRGPDGTLRGCNAAAEKLLGVRLRDQLGTTSLGRLELYDRHGNPIQEQDLPVFECLRTGRSRTGFVLGVFHPEGMRWLENNSQPVLDGKKGKVIGVVSSFWDITEKKQIYERLVKEATHDPLTRLPNRRALEAKLNRALATATRKGRQLSLCLCDLDHFKGVNDQLGHPAGDKVLCRFADTLKLSLRAEDFPARIGGDEFAVLFEGTSAAVAATTLERIRGLFSASSRKGIHRVTATLGIADWVPGMTGEELMKAADEALYVAKERGRNRVQIGGAKT